MRDGPATPQPAEARGVDRRAVSVATRRFAVVVQTGERLPSLLVGHSPLTRALLLGTAYGRQLISQMS